MVQPPRPPTQPPNPLHQKNPPKNTMELPYGVCLDGQSVKPPKCLQPKLGHNVADDVPMSMVQMWLWKERRH